MATFRVKRTNQPVAKCDICGRFTASERDPDDEDDDELWFDFEQFLDLGDGVIRVACWSCVRKHDPERPIISN